MSSLFSLTIYNPTPTNRIVKRSSNPTNQCSAIPTQQFSDDIVSLNIQAPTDAGGGNPSENSFNITHDLIEDNRTPVSVHDSSGGGQGQTGPSIPPDPNIPQLDLGGSAQGQGAGGLDDESWGIDNILVEQISSFRTATTPAPGTLALFGAGIGMISRRRR